jgi:hypothetical protein
MARQAYRISNVPLSIALSTASLLDTPVTLKAEGKSYLRECTLHAAFPEDDTK